ncbi:MAG: hypothetical protein K6A23_15995 [Butyrivibrio sp.]|nr:hypothetical protein [Butyrivibrio sp.]
MNSNYSTSSIAVKITAVAFIVTAIAIAAYSGVVYYFITNSPSELGMKVLGVAAVMMFVLAIAMYSGIKYAVKPLNRVADVIEHVANFDLTEDYEEEIEDLVNRNDEIGHIASCTKDMKDNLTNIAGDIQKLVG